MKTESIEFKSASNITISYPKAALSQRIAAFAIDFSLMSVLSGIVVIVIPTSLLKAVFGLFVFLFWNLSLEIFNKGQSLGKMALKIRIVTMIGEQPSLSQLLIRWMFKIVDVLFTLGCLAMLSIFGSRYGQRIGDLLAGTTVIETKVKYFTDLILLTKLDKIERTITYPAVVMYHDEEMTLIKNAWYRSISNPTPENLLLVKDVMTKLCHDLEIDFPKHKNQVQDIMKVIIEDYIVLTR